MTRRDGASVLWLVQTHLMPTKLPWGEGSRAHWATKPNGSALVFVHGFSGSAVDTWLQFPEFLRQRSETSGSDLLFYGYDSLRTQVRPNAVKLVAFLGELLAQPARTMNSTVDPPLYRDAAFQYDRVTIVAHSLGAVVARRALLDAHKSAALWAPKVTLILFAPAHMGAHLIPFLGAVLGVFRFAPIEAIAKWQFPTLAELTPGSPTLAGLEKDTAKALATGRASYLRAKAVAIAENDNVVVLNDFCDDPVPVVMPRSHVALCKPTETFTMPLDFVLGCL